MSNTYKIVEPHPSARPSQKHIHTARGGAGNTTKAPPHITPGPSATGPPSHLPLSSPSQARRSFASGRGGAGNIHPPSERAIFSFDEELASQLRRDRRVAPIYHVGRGGAGNVTFDKAGEGRREVYIDGSVRIKRKDSETMSQGSGSSSGSRSECESGADVATRQLKRGLVKGWGKIAGVGSYMTA